MDLSVVHPAVAIWMIVKHLDPMVILNGVVEVVEVEALVIHVVVVDIMIVWVAEEDTTIIA